MQGWTVRSTAEGSLVGSTTMAHQSGVVSAPRWEEHGELQLGVPLCSRWRHRFRCAFGRFGVVVRERSSDREASAAARCDDSAARGGTQEQATVRSICRLLSCTIPHCLPAEKPLSQNTNKQQEHTARQRSGKKHARRTSGRIGSLWQ